MKTALVIEVPPSSKKSSSTPIARPAGSPRTSRNWPARKISSGVRGGTSSRADPAPAASGSGCARRST